MQKIAEVEAGMANSRAALSLTICALIVFGCGEETIKRARPECLLNSDCEAPQICIQGYCSEQCHEARDCPAGLNCVAGGCTTDSPPADVDDDVVETTETVGETAEDPGVETEAQEETLDAQEEADTTVDTPGAFETCDLLTGCLDGLFCLVATGTQIGFCSAECADVVACPPAPAGAEDRLACAVPGGSEMASNACTIACQDAQPCPNDLICGPDGHCVANATRSVSPYGVCNVETACTVGRCIQSPYTALGVCGSRCGGGIGCPPPPAGGEAAPLCLEAEGMCVLDCTGGLGCPLGLICINDVSGLSAYCYAEQQAAPPISTSYGTCNGVTIGCVDGDCRLFTLGHGVCAPNCDGGAPCAAAPEGFDAVCLADVGGHSRCFLTCAAEQMCPTGRPCNATRMICD